MSAIDDCGCCTGQGVRTPGSIENRPGQSMISYRIGRHTTFKASMLARLSSAELPALEGLATREDDDFTIALCDAAATMLDVLTFYQERLAQESYLRTAQTRRSVLELARLIDYQLAPGAAASTWLAFTLQEAPGAPEHEAQPVTVPIGTKIQSVPGPDEDPQLFETVEEAETRPAWNAMPVRINEPWVPSWGDTDLYLAGTTTQLKPGDTILIVGKEREGTAGSERWDARLLDTVDIDTAREYTHVSWTNGLGHSDPLILPAAELPRVFAFRQRAALFGHNAPDPRILSTTGSQLSELVEKEGSNGTITGWKDYEIVPPLVDLDASYPKITPGSWFALVSRENYVELYGAKSVAHVSRSGFGVSTKITRLEADTTENLSGYELDSTLVLAESEELAVAERPLDYPLYGASIVLRHLVEGLQSARAIAVSGQRQRIVMADDLDDVDFTLDDGSIVALSPGDSLALAGVPARQLSDGTPEALESADFGAKLTAASTDVLVLDVFDRDGLRGTLVAPAAAMHLASAEDDDEIVAEIVFIDDAGDAVDDDRDRTTLLLATSLAHVYDRESVTVNANVAAATHGETVTEIMGSGNAAEADQVFTLKQSPLTFVSAATTDGRASTLKVTVDDLLWDEVSTLYDRGPDEHVHAAMVGDDGATTLRFGDGAEGARLPTGQDNLRAHYRKGIGTGGNVDAGRLTSLLTPPLGVTEVTNPGAATGGEDAESQDDARTNAPLKVLTLDRAVSIRDYEDYARAYAGISKAHAIWIPSGPGRGVFVTVAGIDGAEVPQGSETLVNLVSSLRQYGDPLLPLEVVSYEPGVSFRIDATIEVADDADAEIVLPDVEAKLRDHFAFGQRSFGQSVSVDEVASAIHEADGVVATHVRWLHRSTLAPSLEPRLHAAVPVASLEGRPEPAEILVIDESGITLGVMT